MSSTVQQGGVRAIPIPGESDRENGSQQADDARSIRPLLASTSGDARRAPFDGFVSAALSALLAVLLAWRFLLFSDERALSDKHTGSTGVDCDQPAVIVEAADARRPSVPRIEITPSPDDRQMDAADDWDERPAPLELSSTNPFYDELVGSDGDSVIMADAADATDDATRAAEDQTPAAAATSDRPEHDGENCMRELCTECDDIEPATADDNQRDSSLRSVRKLLATDVLVLSLDDDYDNLDEIERVFFGDGMHDMIEPESDISSDNGPLPPYLDTITEEDSDDLRSQSSCSSQVMSRSATLRAADSMVVDGGDVRANSVSPAIPIYPLAVTVPGDSRNDQAPGFSDADSLADDDTLITPLATSLTETEDDDDAASVVDVTIIATGPYYERCLLVETAPVVASSSTSGSSDSVPSSPSPEPPALCAESPTLIRDDQGVTVRDNGRSTSAIDPADTVDRLVTPPPAAFAAVHAVTVGPALLPDSAPIIDAPNADDNAGLNLDPTSASSSFTPIHTDDLSRSSNGSHTFAQDLRFSRAYQNFFVDRRSPEMDIDLERAMRRFTRYGQVYRDAPHSELEEFTKDKEQSPRSSADTSFTNVLLFPGRHGKDAVRRGRQQSSPDTTTSSSPYPAGNRQDEMRSSISRGPTRASPDSKVRFADSTADSDESGSAVGTAAPPISKLQEERSMRKEDSHTVENTPGGRREVTKSEKSEVLYSSQTLTKTFDVPKRAGVFDNPFSDQKFVPPEGIDKKTPTNTIFSPVARNYGSDLRSFADSTAKRNVEPARVIPVEREYSSSSKPPAARPPPPAQTTMSQQRQEPRRPLDSAFNPSQSSYRREEHLATTLTTITTSTEKLVGSTKRPTDLFTGGKSQVQPVKQEVVMGYMPEVRRIDPPKQVERVFIRDDDEFESKRFTNPKAYFGSSEHLHQLLDGSYKKKPQHSKEMEEKLMREAQERRRIEEEERRRAETEKRRAEEERRRIEEERRAEEEERRRIEAEKRRVEEERRLIEQERRRLEDQRSKYEEERVRLEAQNRRLELERRQAESERRRVSEEQMKQEADRQRLFDERKRMGMLLTSRETLQHLTKEPYYQKARSKETLFTNNNNHVSTTYVDKIEHHEVRRYEVDPVPLNEQNLRSWSNRPENIADQSKNMYRWRNSMNLTDVIDLKSPPNNYAPSSQQSQSSAAQELPSPAPPRERIYTQRKLPDEDENAFNRGSTKRTSRYKAKIDKARRDFLTQQEGDNGYSGVTKIGEEISEKFKKSTEDMRRPKPEYRGPLLQKFHSGEFNSKVDLSDLPPMTYGKVAPSPYDQEYKRLVAKAEQNWASYKKRMSQPNLYSRNRAWSTSYLETDVDTGKGGQVPSGARQVEETDLDDVHGHGYAPSDYERTSRNRTKAPPGPSQVDSHTRSKSADYLMDRRAREETEPPENQLQKILGEASREASEHELRFRKSIDKLHVPDWYLNSEYCGHKVDLDASRSTALSYPNYSAAETPLSPATPVRQFYELVRPTSSQSHYQQYEQRQQQQQPVSQPAPYSTTTHQQQSTVRSSEQTSYTSPWSQGGRFSGPQPQGTSQRYQEQSAPQPTATRTRTKSPTPLGKDFTGVFEKYRGEIEELRRSRTSLHKLAHDANEPNYGTGNVPVATVKPRQQGAPEQSHSSMSTSPSGVVFRPVTEQSNFKREEFGSHEGIFTSTPRSSGHLTRKHIPDTIANKQYEIPVQRLPSTQTTTIQQQDYQYQQKNQHLPQTAQRSVYDQFQQQSAPVATQSAYQQQTFQPQTYQSQPIKPSTMTTTTTTTVQQQYHQERKQETVIESSVRQLPGYTVSTLPTAWNEPKNRNSVVIEVADTFVGPKRVVDGTGKVSQRYGGRVTLEEVLDSILALPSQRTAHMDTLDESNEMDTSLPQIERPTTPVPIEGPAIYTKNYMLMDHVIKNQPDNAEELLKNEALQVRCGYCNRTNVIDDARERFVSCKHCYTYYCSRVCRRAGWERHKDRCSFARVNTMCKDVIMKVREDPEAQWQMSRVARQGYATRGRGSVNFRFRSPFMAETYVKGGWAALSAEPGNYLFYYTIPTLIEERKEPSLIALCRKYDPRGKFILSVSIIADIEQCPSTPPPESVDQSWAARPELRQPAAQYVAKQHTDLNGNSLAHQYSPSSHHRQNSLPHRYHRGQQQSSQPDTKTVLKSVLRSLENIAPGPLDGGQMSRSSSAQHYYRPITPQAIRSDV